MLKVSLFLAVCLIASVQSHSLEKRFFLSGGGTGGTGGGIFPGIIPLPDPLALINNAVSSFQSTFTQLTSGFHNSLQGFLDGNCPLVNLAGQIQQHLGTLGVQLPYNVFEHPSLNIQAFKTCQRVAYEPTLDNKQSCIYQLFPQVRDCLHAAHNPSEDSILQCSNSVGFLDRNLQYCLNFVKQPTEENFLGCGALVANMAVPNAGAPLAVALQCKSLLAQAPNCDSVRKCGLEVLNSVVAAHGAQHPFLGHVQGIAQLSECVHANLQSPQNLIQECAATLGQVANLPQFTQLLSQFTQCKTSGNLKQCVGQLITNEAQVSEIPSELLGSVPQLL